jgi:hypothetical protein
VTFKKGLLWLASIGLFIALVVIYKNYNPYENNFFPKCLIKELTGYKCIGCGSQRAAHFLLNFEFQKACKENIMFVFALPYILTGFVFELLKNKNRFIVKWRKILFGQIAIYLILTVFIAFWIIRNIS